jgi:hypothetical protein
MVGNSILKLASGHPRNWHMSEDLPTFNFPDEVRTAFKFLKDHGFKVTSETSHRVRYESNEVFIEILYGSYDCEVAIEFGRLRKEERYSFTLFLQLVNPNLGKQMGDRIAYEPNQVRTALTNLAKAIESDGQEILNGKDAVFERMKSVRWWDFQPDALKKKFLL